MIIGLGHEKRQGKDTCAKMLFDIYAARGKFPTIISFADPLYAFCHKMYPGFLSKKEYDEDTTGLKEIKLPVGFTPRELLLGVGEKLRELDPFIWARYGINDSRNCDVAIITDVRHPNEVDLLMQAGAVLVKVVRPSVPVGAGDIDAYLKGQDVWDHEICNDGSLDDLKQKCIELVDRIAQNG